MMANRRRDTRSARKAGAFGIGTARAYFAKVESDTADFLGAIDDPRLAFNAFVSLHHFHDWIWATELKVRTPFKLGNKSIREKGDFTAWCADACLHFDLIQEVANGIKHCSVPHLTERVAGFGMGPFGIGPFGQPHLVIDLGDGVSPDRWKIAHEVVADGTRFWRDFLEAHSSVSVVGAQDDRAGP